MGYLVARKNYKNPSNQGATATATFEFGTKQNKIDNIANLVY